MHYIAEPQLCSRAGVVSLAAITHADEKATPLLTALSSQPISGYVNTSAIWRPGTQSRRRIPARAFDGSAAKQDGFEIVSERLEIKAVLLGRRTSKARAGIPTPGLVPGRQMAGRVHVTA